MAKKTSKNKKINNPKPAKKPVKTLKKKLIPKKKPAKKVVVKKKVLKKQKPAVKKADLKKQKTSVTKQVIVKKPAEAPAQAPKQIKTQALPEKEKAKKPAPQLPASPAETADKPLKVTVKSGPKKPEPKGKYVMEFSVRSSIPILFEFISTPSGLAEWFSDNVNVQTGGFFTFFWDGVGQQSKLIGYRDQEMVRFEWVAKKDGSYFEFRIQTDELTGDVSLIIIDFSDPAELQTNKLVWDSQVNKLLHLIGSYSG